MNSGVYFSESKRETVYVYKISRNRKYSYDCCENCGKPLTKTIYSITGEDGTEALYGTECVKSLKLRKEAEQ